MRPRRYLWRMVHYSRRSILVGAAALGGLAGVGVRPTGAVNATEIAIGTRVIEVKGKAATVFGLTQPDGRHGLIMNAGDPFRVRLTNSAGEPALIHWHGLTPPNAQDGVPGVTQPHLATGESHDYDFKVALPGTNWMHSHHTLQEQRLMAAPLIVRDPAEAGLDEHEIVVMLHDFMFRPPEEVLEALGKGMSHDHGAMNQGAASDAPGMPMPGLDLNDVAHDAFLANDRALDDPEVVRVEKGQRVRLRIINGAASTNFLIDLGGLTGSLTDVDGRPIVPVVGSRFPLAIAQRADIRVTLPSSAGAWPVLFQREGDAVRTGLILATRDAAIAKVSDTADQPIGAIEQEVAMRYLSAAPLPARKADSLLMVDLTGSMMTYRWGIGDAASPHQHLLVQQGERVEMTLTNRTAMSHPMHLHGHHFQVVAIDGVRVAGVVRDTELVPVGGSVTLAFDADNPGKWMFHCHNLYHMLSGMMTQVRYT